MTTCAPPPLGLASYRQAFAWVCSIGFVWSSSRVAPRRRVDVNFDVRRPVALEGAANLRRAGITRLRRK